MPNLILTETTASVSELKKNPMGTVALGEGFPIAILTRADSRMGQAVVKVSLAEL